MTITKTLLVAGLLAAFGSQSARADFTYSATVNVANDPTLPPDSGGTGSQTIDVGLGNQLTYSTTGLGATSLPINPAVPGGADVNFGSVAFIPNATDDVGTGYSVNFNFNLVITDVDSGASGTINYTGQQSGFVQGLGVNGSSINSTFLFAVSPTALVLGSNTYEFTAIQPVGPGSSGGVLSEGSFALNVRTRTVPEPGSLALMGLGVMTLVGLAARRRMAANSSV